jgi:PHD/YefM family antitoxin component YafN of YafNO toxin-antitoxin module
MSVREDLHQRIDALPEDRLADVMDYLADLQDEDTSLSPGTMEAIDEGLDDIRDGRTISLADYRHSRRL